MRDTFKRIDSVYACVLIEIILATHKIIETKQSLFFSLPELWTSSLII